MTPVARASRISFRRLRVGELLALAGAICVIASLLAPWYEGPAGTLSAWDTFGAAVALLLVAACAALALVLGTLTERSTALPVSTAVWCVPLGLIATIAAIVRVIERPEHSTSLCIGAWLALAGSIAILLGAWQALRDERPSMYDAATPQPRPRP
jgi:hypothetical protein